MFGLGFKGARGQEKKNGQISRRQEKTGDKDEILEWAHQIHKDKRSTISQWIVFISCVVATILYSPLKGETNTDPAIAETVDTDPAPPAEVTVEKEAEAAPPPAEVTQVTVEKEVEAEGMRVSVCCV